MNTIKKILSWSHPSFVIKIMFIYLSKFIKLKVM
jgi:hypothetical protein